MEIIDLLSINKKEMPKSVKHYSGIYFWEKEKGDFFKKTPSGDGLLQWCVNTFIIQNHFIDEIEILEEEKKIPEKIPIGLKQTKDGIFNTIVKDDIHYELNEKEEIICKKIHEIIDYLKSKGE